MIMEEITRLKKIDEITSRLAVVTEELNRLKEEEGIEEVSVGGTRNGDEWYEKGVPVAKFEKKGSHLKEEDPIDAAEELPSDDIGADMGGDAMGDETIEVGDDIEVGAPETFEEKLAAVGRELDMKLAGAGAVDDTSDDMLDTPSDEVPAEEPEMELGDADDAGEEEEKDSEEIEIDEVDASMETDETEECDTTLEESKEEVAPINESVDRLGRKANPILEKELKRAQYLAGLSDE